VTVETVAGVTTTLGGLAIDEHAMAAPGVFACGADAGGIGTGGYASGLAPRERIDHEAFLAELEVRSEPCAQIYHEGGPQPLREVAGRVVSTLDGADPELDGVQRIVRDGNGADRQRAVYGRGGVPALLRHLAEATTWPARG
jgi:hypothetical protein